MRLCCCTLALSSGDANHVSSHSCNGSQRELAAGIGEAGGLVVGVGIRVEGLRIGDIAIPRVAAEEATLLGVVPAGAEIHQARPVLPFARIPDARLSC